MRAHVSVSTREPLNECLYRSFCCISVLIDTSKPTNICAQGVTVWLILCSFTPSLDYWEANPWDLNAMDHCCAFLFMRVILNERSHTKWQSPFSSVAYIDTPQSRKSCTKQSHTHTTIYSRAKVVLSIQRAMVMIIGRYVRNRSVSIEGQVCFMRPFLRLDLIFLFSHLPGHPLPCELFLRKLFSFLFSAIPFGSHSRIGVILSFGTGNAHNLF